MVGRASVQWGGPLCPPRVVFSVPSVYCLVTSFQNCGSGFPRPPRLSGSRWRAGSRDGRDEQLCCRMNSAEAETIRPTPGSKIRNCLLSSVFLLHRVSVSPLLRFIPFCLQPQAQRSSNLQRALCSMQMRHHLSCSYLFPYTLYGSFHFFKKLTLQFTGLALIVVRANI